MGGSYLRNINVGLDVDITGDTLKLDSGDTSHAKSHTHIWLNKSMIGLYLTSDPDKDNRGREAPNQTFCLPLWLRTNWFVLIFF